MMELAFAKDKKTFSWWLDKTGTIIAFVIIVSLFSILSPYFGTASNIENLFIQISPLLIAALGITFVNMAGESDLSLGGTFGLGVTLFCGFLRSGINPVYCVFLVIAICVAFGAISGLLVAYSKLSSFIVTTAVMFIAMGVERTYNGGFSIWIRNKEVLEFANGSFLGISNFVIVSLAFFVITLILLHQTKFGVHLQAVGENYETSNMMGISVKKLKFVSFCFASAFYGIAGVLYAMRSSGAIVYSGQKVLLPALAVTFVAKTVLGAKRPNVFGILIGALILGVINNAFTLLGVQFFYIPIVQGLVLVIAAAISTMSKRDIQQENLN